MVNGLVYMFPEIFTETPEITDRIQKKVFRKTAKRHNGD